MFNLLDSDGDGEITASNIDISSLSDHVIQIIAPLLCEMEKENLTINFESFYVSCLKLIQVKYKHFYLVFIFPLFSWYIIYRDLISHRKMNSFTTTKVNGKKKNQSTPNSITDRKLMKDLRSLPKKEVIIM